MAEPGSFIKLYRSVQDHWLWEDKPFSKGQAWVDLLMIANYADEKRMVGNKLFTYPRGSVPRSITSLAKRWGWNRKTVKAFLDALEADNMVTVNGSTNGTTVTIENYSKFQNVGSTKRTTSGQLSGQRRDNVGTQYKKVKESKESKEAADAPSLDAGRSPQTEGYPAKWAKWAQEKGMTLDEYIAWRTQ